MPDTQIPTTKSTGFLLRTGPTGPQTVSQTPAGSNLQNHTPAQTKVLNAAQSEANAEAAGESWVPPQNAAAIQAADDLVQHASNDLPFPSEMAAVNTFAGGRHSERKVAALHRALVNAHIDAAFQRAAINAKINANASTSPPTTNPSTGLPPPVAKDLQTNP